MKNTLKQDILKQFNIDVLKEKNIYYEGIYDDALKKFNNETSILVEINKSTYADLLKKIKYKKANWIKLEKSNKNSAYNKKIKATEDIFSFDNTKVKGCNNIQEFKNMLDRELDKWKNIDIPLVNYPYLLTKQKRTVEKALEEDIILRLYKYEEKNKRQKNVKDEIMPNSLNQIPIDTSNRLKLSATKEDYIYKFKNKHMEYMYSIKINEFNSLMAAKDISKVINIIKKVLNKTDIRVFNYILQFRDKNFFENGLIKFELNAMCKELFGYKTEQYKNSILGSLYKMSIIKGNGYTEGKSSVLASLLGDIIVGEEIDGKIEITTTVGLTYRSDIIQGNIVKIHGGIIKKLDSNSDAYIIIFYLQKRRLQQYYNKDKDIIELDNNQYVEKRIPYTDIASLCMISDKNKSRLIKRIKDVLEVIVDEGSILSDVYSYGDFFDLTYTPLTDEEIDDIEKRIKIKDKEIKGKADTPLLGQDL